MNSVTLNDMKAQSLIEKMLDMLYKKDRFLLENNVTERAITHRMGMYLQHIVNDSFDVDCEYNRMGKPYGNEIYFTDGDYFAKTVCLTGENILDSSDVGSRVYPDIIIHKRGTAENILIIEVKIAGKVGKREHDFKKLKAYKEDLLSKFAFFIELGKIRETVHIERIN